jgi:universal stress protein A
MRASSLLAERRIHAKLAQTKEPMTTMKTKQGKANRQAADPKPRRKPAAAIRRTHGSKKAGTAVASPMQIRSILVPIDFSAHCLKALDYAVPLAARFGAKLTLLHVIEPVATPDCAKSFPLAMESDRVTAECKAQLDRLVRQKGVPSEILATTLVRHGRSYNEITAAARSLKTDLIVVSTHGYTGWKHALLGSTTELVVRHAPCPVLVVRDQEHEFLVR